MKLTAIITTLLYTSTTSSYVKADNNNNNIHSPEALEALADKFNELAALLFASANEADTLDRYGDHLTSAEMKDALKQILDSTKVAEMLGDEAGDEAAVLFDSIWSTDNAPPEQMLFSRGGSKGIINIVGNSRSSKPKKFTRIAGISGFGATEEFATWNNALGNAGRTTVKVLGSAESSTVKALDNAESTTAKALDNAKSTTAKALNEATHFMPSQQMLFRGSVQAAKNKATTAAASSVATAQTAAAHSCLVAAEALENASKVTGDALNTGASATVHAAETAIYAAENAANIAEASVGFTVDLTENVLSSFLW